MSLVSSGETPEPADPGEGAFDDPSVFSEMAAAFDTTPGDAWRYSFFEYLMQPLKDSMARAFRET